jgi:hypothetical protein
LSFKKNSIIYPRVSKRLHPLGGYMSRSREGARALKNTNPDRGPKMIEGAHKFDKGYESDDDTFQPTKNMFPSGQRGNEYMKLNNEWQKKDAGKLARQKFSKTA